MPLQIVPEQEIAGKFSEKFSHFSNGYDKIEQVRIIPDYQVFEKTCNYRCFRHQRKSLSIGENMFGFVSNQSYIYLSLGNALDHGAKFSMVAYRLASSGLLFLGVLSSLYFLAATVAEFPSIGHL